MVSNLQKGQNSHQKCTAHSNKVSQIMQRRVISRKIKKAWFTITRIQKVQVYKILNDIDKVDKDKLFTTSNYGSTCGHTKKLFKERPRLNIRAKF